MAWETRARGARYYVRKRWQAGRCVSEYIGTGAHAEILARLDAAGRAQERALRTQRRRAEESDAVLDALDTAAGLLTTAGLLMAGCHTHKGQWRRRREPICI